MTYLKGIFCKLINMIKNEQKLNVFKIIIYVRRLKTNMKIIAVMPNMMTDRKSTRLNSSHP